MPNYKNKRNYENLQKENFIGIGNYEIPELQPTRYEHCEWVGFNYAMSCKERAEKGIHFFLDDYQFTRLWRDPDKYIPILQEFQYVMTPDFSLYTDFPSALQIYNHYRKHWLGAYWQEHGIHVIPTIGWSTPNSFEWCFDGEPTHSTVAISSVGTQNGKEKKKLFLDGYNEMLRRLEPELIIFYGGVPEECKGNIVRIKAFQDKFKEVKSNGW